MLLRNAPAARVTLDLFLRWGNQIACLPKTSNVLNRFIGLSSNRLLHYGRVYTRLIVVKSCRARRSTHTGTIRISLVDSVIRQLYNANSCKVRTNSLNFVLFSNYPFHICALHEHQIYPKCRWYLIWYTWLSAVLASRLEVFSNRVLYRKVLIFDHPVRF